MTYVNGTDDYDAMNVSMLESESFGPDLLMLETTKPIEKDEELFMYYGSEFILPVNDPIDVYSSGSSVKVGIRPRTKIAARLRAPPMSPAAPPKRLFPKKKSAPAPSLTLGKRNASEAGGGSNKKTKRNRNGE
jgi:hypothetical protein